MKNEQTIWVFTLQKYGKFSSIFLSHFIKHKPLISEDPIKLPKCHFFQCRLPMLNVGSSAVTQSAAADGIVAVFNRLVLRMFGS